MTASKAAFTNAILCYLQASEFIRNFRPPGEERLFNLSTNDVDEEATFRENLTNALASLDHPVKFSPDDHYSVYAGSYFAGAKSLRSLLPKFDGNLYVNNSLPDYTFGGFLVDLPVCDVEAGLREELGNVYAGIYAGSVNSFEGDFAVIIRANAGAPPGPIG